MIYLDNAASTALLPEVVKVVNKYFCEVYANPSGAHALSIEANKAVEISAKIFAKYLGAEPQQFVFTSGATEGNNMVILQPQWLSAKQPLHFITSKIEHPSVLNCFRHLEKLGHRVTYLGVDRNGILSESEMLTCLEKDTALVSLIYANNEIGTINDIASLANSLRNNGFHGKIHTDATQAIGKIAIDLEQLNVDYLTASAHKLHAPKGVGLLYLRDSKIEPLLIGGGQQNGLRSGTLNSAGIAGFAKALELLTKDKSKTDAKYQEFAEILKSEIDFDRLNAKIIAEDSPRLSNIYAIAFKAIKSEVLLNALSARGIMVSSGSACSSKKKTVSHVLEAIDLEEDYQDGVIRISFSCLTTRAEVIEFCQAINELVPKLHI